MTQNVSHKSHCWADLADGTEVSVSAGCPHAMSIGNQDVASIKCPLMDKERAEGDTPAMPSVTTWVTLEEVSESDKPGAWSPYVDH